MHRCHIQAWELPAVSDDSPAPDLDAVSPDIPAAIEAIFGATASTAAEEGVGSDPEASADEHSAAAAGINEPTPATAERTHVALEAIRQNLDNPHIVAAALDRLPALLSGTDLSDVLELLGVALLAHERSTILLIAAVRWCTRTAMSSNSQASMVCSHCPAP